MKDKTPADRLPTFDNKTANAEAAAFAGLGLAALLVIVAAASGSMRYADQREAIVQSLTAPATVIVQTPATPKAATNIAARVSHTRPSGSS
jgi:hypothetical protein